VGQRGCGQCPAEEEAKHITYLEHLDLENKSELDGDGARRASLEQIPVLLHEHREDVLRGLLENPHFEELHLCLLLGRAELSTALLEEIAKHKGWMISYRVKRALAFHHNLPPSLGLSLVRELYQSDLVALSFSPSGNPALRHLAEDLVLAKLPQLPPAQKMTLARRGSPRIVGALLTEGSPESLPTVLDSPLLNEGHVLKALARVALSVRIVTAIADHAKWSHIYSVRLALLRNSQAPMARVLTFLPNITTTDLKILSQSSSVPSRLVPHIRRELANRMQHGKAPVRGRQ
jgi:hypothetical protein